MMHLDFATYLFHNILNNHYYLFHNILNSHYSMAAMKMKAVLPPITQQQVL